MMKTTLDRIRNSALMLLAVLLASAASAADVEDTRPGASATTAEPGWNPIIRDVFTADPAPVVIGDTVYLYAGHDNAKDGEMFTMPDWLCFSTKDMKHWTAHGAVLSPTNFSWGSPNSAWAAQVVPKDGKFFY